MDFLLTGTQVYGPATKDSDLDIVMMIDAVPGVINFLAEKGIKMWRTPGQDEYGAVGGFYFDFAGIKVNIIIADNEWEFKEWKRRTEKMKKLPPIEDREKRVAVFNGKEPA